MTQLPDAGPPELSVVVPSVNGWEDLEGCVEALEIDKASVALEVVVVDRLGEPLRKRLGSRFPWVKVVCVDRQATIPEMRVAGIDASTAPAVGIIEDHVLVRPGWGRAMLDQLAGGARVVGGSIENAATDTVCDWATFLCEYSHCLPPLPDGPAEWLTGNNVVYARSVLTEQRSVLDEHKWENRLHDAIKASGTELICRSAIVVDHKKHFTVGSYSVLRYQFSRSYAGARSDGWSLPKRLVFGAASVLLPPVLFYRTVSRIRAKGKHMDRLVPSLPYIAVFVVVWAVGEAVGYLAGPGDSLARVT
jgi:hypothetical protein